MTRPFDFDLAVIGGGAAGLSVAAGAARLGVRTLLVEKEPALGGDCLHHGCVPSKTLLKTARVRRLMARARDFGLPAVALPPVDFTAVAGRIRHVIQAIQVHDSPERFRSLGAEVIFGPAAFVDEHTLDVACRRYSAARLVLATGSSAAIPALPGLESVPFLTNRELFRLDRLPASLVILGAGPMAMEMAQAFFRLGSHVTVIQRGGQILSKEDPDMAQMAMDALLLESAQGLPGAGTLDIRLGVTVAAVRLGQTRNGNSGDTEGVAVDVRDASGAISTIHAERLLVALGRAPNVAGLDLGKAGVAFTAKGVTVDSRLRTSQPHIFAAGDVTGAFPFTHAAGYEAGVVVSNAVFRLPRKADYRLLPWCTYTEPELASIGLNETRAAAQGVAYRVWSEEFRANDRAQTEGETTGRLKLLVDRRGRPLGVQILGPHAGEILNAWVVALGGTIRLATLAAATHPYPTLGEISKRVAGAVLAERLFSNTVRRTLRLLFRYRG